MNDNFMAAAKFNDIFTKCKNNYRIWYCTKEYKKVYLENGIFQQVEASTKAILTNWSIEVRKMSFTV